MAKADALALERAYRLHLAAIRAETLRETEAQYGKLDPDAVNASFASLAPGVVDVLRDAQGLAQETASAYVEAYVAEASERPYQGARFAKGVVGTRLDGSPLLAGLLPIAGMILRSIASGASVDEAVEAGRWYSVRYADNATLGAADREVAHQMRSSRRISGWQRVLHGSKTCAPCAAQLSGGPNDPFYRHARCACERIPVVA